MSQQSPKILDILLMFRDIEENLLNHLEATDPTLYDEAVKELSNREDKLASNEIEEVYSQLTYIEDAIHVLIQEKSLGTVESLLQYQSIIKK